MSDAVKLIADRIRALEIEFEAELAKRRAALRFGLERGRVQFEQEILRRHAQLKTHVLAYIANAHPLVVLTAPVIYGLIVPLLILDLAVTVYQYVCFPAYGIERVSRRDYFQFDRRHLAYLNCIEKVNCAYCSYANGVLAYAVEIGGRTEKYWCPIKHARRAVGAHPHYREFLDYGDADAFRRINGGGDGAPPQA